MIISFDILFVETLMPVPTFITILLDTFAASILCLTFNFKNDEKRAFIFCFRGNDVDFMCESEKIQNSGE